MKKIIGILGVAFIAAAMFFTTNSVISSKSNITLGSLTTMNIANAQGPGWEPNCPDPTIRYIADNFPCFKLRDGQMVMTGSHVVCVAFETCGVEGSATCTGTNCP